MRSGPSFRTDEVEWVDDGSYSRQTAIDGGRGGRGVKSGAWEERCGKRSVTRGGRLWKDMGTFGDAKVFPAKRLVARGLRTSRLGGVRCVDDFDRGGAGFGFCLAGVGGVP